MPTRAQYSLDPNVLRNFSLDLTPEFSGLRAIRRMVPFAPIPKRQFKYQIHSKTWYTDETETLRPYNAEPQEVYRDLSSANDTAHEHALMHPITDDELNESDEVLDPYEDGVALVRFKLLLRLLKTIATSVEDTATWGAGNSDTLAGADQWSDPTSKPVTAILDAGEVVRQEHGITLDMLTLVLTPYVAKALKLNPQIISKIGGGFAGMVNPSLDQLRNILGVKEIVVLDGVYNTANPGQTASMGDIFGKHAWLVLAPEGGLMRRRQKSCLAVFVRETPQEPQDDDYISWSTVPRTSSRGVFQKSRWAIGTMTYKFKVLEKTFGYLWKNASA